MLGNDFASEMIISEGQVSLLILQVILLIHLSYLFHELPPANLVALFSGGNLDETENFVL